MNWNFSSGRPSTRFHDWWKAEQTHPPTLHLFYKNKRFSILTHLFRFRACTDVFKQLHRWSFIIRYFLDIAFGCHMKIHVSQVAIFLINCDISAVRNVTWLCGMWGTIHRKLSQLWRKMHQRDVWERKTKLFVWFSENIVAENEPTFGR